MRQIRWLPLLLAALICCACVRTQGGSSSRSDGSSSTIDSSSSTSDSADAQGDAPASCYIVMPDGLPAVGLAQLAGTTAELGGSVLTFEVFSTPDALVASVIKGEPDIAVVPSNVAATQYHKGAGYLIAGTVSQGSAYLVTTDESVGGLADLVGRTVYNIGRGLTPDLVFRALLTEKGLDPEAIDFTYVSAASELLPAVISGQATVAVVPEPALSTLMDKRPDLRVVADVNALWQESYGTAAGYPQSTLIVKETLVQQSPQFVAQLVAQVAASERAVYETPDAVGALFEALHISVDPASLIRAGARLGLVFAPIAEAKGDYLTYYGALFALDPSTIGGGIPDDAVFYTAP